MGAIIYPDPVEAESSQKYLHFTSSLSANLKRHRGHPPPQPASDMASPPNALHRCVVQVLSFTVFELVSRAL